MLQVTTSQVALNLCSYLEVESQTHTMNCYEHDLNDGNLFGLLVLALEVELEDGAPELLGHCSQRCD